MVKFNDFSRPLSVFQVLFKANFIFKDFQDSHIFSSTFKPMRTLLNSVTSRYINQKFNHILVSNKCNKVAKDPSYHVVFFFNKPMT